MRDKLVRYVDLLFAGAPKASEVKQEILQNTLDRYDDLTAQGKSSEAAYQLAISGIGDIREILINTNTVVTRAAVPKVTTKPLWKKVLQAIAICLYILSPLPLFILQNELGLCGVLACCAVATVLIIIGSGDAQPEKQDVDKPKNEVHKAISAIITILGLVAYFAISFYSGAWYITWIIFPLCGAINGLVRACFDLKGAKYNEE